MVPALLRSYQVVWTKSCPVLSMHSRQHAESCCCVADASFQCRLAGLFVKPSFYEPLVALQDPLAGLHANTHLAQACCPVCIRIHTHICICNYIGICICIKASRTTAQPSKSDLICSTLAFAASCHCAKVLAHRPTWLLFDNPHPPPQPNHGYMPSGLA